MNAERPPLVMHIIQQLSADGAEKQLVLLVQELRSRFKFVVVHYDPDSDHYAKDLRELGAEVVLIRREPGVLGKFRFLRTLVQVIREHDPDVIHTWMVSANFWGRCAGAIAGARKRVIAAVRNVRELNSVLLERCFDLLLSKFSIAVISNTDAARDSLVNYGVPANKVHVIPNGIEPDLYAPNLSPEDARGRLGIAPTRTVIGTIGRLTAAKNHDLFITMAQRLQESFADTHFVIVGDGELHEHLENRIRQLGMSDSFTLTGRRSDVPQILKSFDLFVLTSSWEGLPNVLMEAMCARVPVVATAVGGVPELVSDNRTGLLVRSGDLEALVSKVSQLLADGGRRHDLSLAARQAVEKRYGLRHTADLTADLYMQAITARFA